MTEERLCTRGSEGTRQERMADRDYQKYSLHKNITYAVADDSIPIRYRRFFKFISTTSDEVITLTWYGLANAFKNTSIFLDISRITDDSWKKI